MDLFEIPAQCCDAKHYLAMGEGCASGGGCYNILRPMGAVYWFSIPYRLNLPLDILVILHCLLTATSVVLSTLVIKKIMLRHITPDPTARKYAHYHSLSLVLALFSLLAHIVFLYPVINHSMSDPPSSLLFLIAIWLLFLLPERIFPRTLLLLTCGLLLGLAAWIRSFFLYPVLIALSAWVLYVFARRPFQPRGLVILVALLPIASQFYVTWQKTGSLSYIHPSEAAIHQGFVMAEKASGYDTVLPGIGFRTYPTCKNYRALGEALTTGDIYSIACLMSGKLHYYLGSYSPHMFWDPQPGKVIIEGDMPSLQSRNLQYTSTTENNLPGGKTALKIYKPDNRLDGELFYTLDLREGSKYFPSLLAWSQENYQMILLSVRKHDSLEEIHSRTVILTNTPQLIQMSVYHQSNERYDVVIKFPFIDPDTNADVKTFIAAGNKINYGSFFIADPKLAEAEYKDERFWFPGILLANLLAVISALLLIFQYRKSWTSECWMAFGLTGLCCAEALLITPEQRFIIAPIITLWILCISWISPIILQRFLSRPSHGPV